MAEVHVDLSQIVGVIAAVLMEPYLSLIDRLHADGRVTDAEVEELRAGFHDRTARLGELVAARLRELREEGEDK